jgi:AcrR family transcriptional regulator
MLRGNPRCRIGPEHWISAALDALADEGERGVSVEALARHLKVTKGSFYHHFTDRDSLWAALLGQFAERGAAAVIAELTRTPDPRDRLRRLFAAAWNEPRLLRAERALLTSQRPDVVASLAEVHRVRRAFLVACYAELGLAPSVAAQRAATAYAVFLGAVVLSDQPPFDDAATLGSWVESVTPQLLP